MSRRPIETKQRRRVSKLFTATPPAYFDLVQWLVSRGHAKTKRAAREMILARKVRADSHPLGIMKLPVTKPNGEVEEVEIVNPRVPVAARERIIVG